MDAADRPVLAVVVEAALARDDVDLARAATHAYVGSIEELGRRLEPSVGVDYCEACDGYYGVPHIGNHCQDGQPSKYRPEQCACRPCCEASGRPIQGAYGLLLA